MSRSFLCHWQMAFSRLSSEQNSTDSKLGIPGGWFKAVSSGNMNDEHAVQSSTLLFTDTWPFQDHLATKTIISTKSSVCWENGSKLYPPGEWFEGLFPETNQWICRANVSPGSSTFEPFQDHLPSNTVILTSSSVSRRPAQWICSLHPCHWWMACSRPPSEQNCTNLKCSLPEEWFRALSAGSPDMIWCILLIVTSSVLQGLSQWEHSIVI